MITNDIILIAALMVYLVAWWMRSLKSRSTILGLSALVAVVSGALGVYEHRWQDGVGGGVAVVFLLVFLVNKLRNTATRQGVPWVSGSVMTVLVSLAFAPIYLFPVPDLPAPSGEYAVGSKTFELTDNSRLGVSFAKDDEPRRLLVRVWYPAGDISGLTRRPYFTDEEVETTAVSMANGLGAPFLFQYFKHSTTNTYFNAPLVTIKNKSKFPVVVYSHGLGLFAGQSTALMEELASHGYQVYSIQHTYYSYATVFPNGDVVDKDPAPLPDVSTSDGARDGPSEAKIKSFTGLTLTERYEGKIDSWQEYVDNDDQTMITKGDVWLKDRIFVLNQLERGIVPEQVEDIVSAGDFSRTAQMGMSFGGSTSGAICMVDKRCAVAVNLDGGDLHGKSFNKNLPVPLLMLYSDFENIIEQFGGNENSLRRGLNDFSYERHETAGLRNDVYRVQVKKAQHMGISDFSLFMRSKIKELLVGSIEAEHLIQIQNDFVLGFLDKHFLNKQNEFPKVAYAKHAPRVEKNDISDIREWWLESYPKNVTERVVIKTSIGEIELALYPERAPVAVNNFLAQVDAGNYKDTSFYRADSNQPGSHVGFVQDELFLDTVAQHKLKIPELILTSLSDEKMSETGILKERGTISVASSKPSTAESAFFVNMQDNSGSNNAETIKEQDNASYTTFGRVLRGMRILEQIKTQVDNVNNVSSGQLLKSLITIKGAYRVNVD